MTTAVFAKDAASSAQTTKDAVAEVNTVGLLPVHNVIGQEQPMKIEYVPIFYMQSF